MSQITGVAEIKSFSGSPGMAGSAAIPDLEGQVSERSAWIPGPALSGSSSLPIFNTITQEEIENAEKSTRGYAEDNAVPVLQ